jgi:predicted NBD/HSP70 family sugar kinase
MLPLPRSCMVLHDYGNISSSSTWYTFGYLESVRGTKRGDRVLQLGIGSGVKCGVNIWRALRDVHDVQDAWAHRVVDPAPLRGRRRRSSSLLFALLRLLLLTTLLLVALFAFEAAYNAGKLAHYDNVAAPLAVAVAPITAVVREALAPMAAPLLEWAQGMMVL